MTDDITIGLEPDAQRPRYAARQNDREVGEVRLSRLSADTLAINHVEVAPFLRGSGLAERLVRRVVEDSRAAGTRLVPRCPYAVLLFRRKPEWRDVLAG